MRKSLIGKKFGRLEVVGCEGVKNKNSYWVCKCECGNECVVARPSLTGGKTKSCGCIQSTSLIGQKFGKLLVVDSAGKKDGTTYWVCKCECRKIVIVRRGHLTDKGTQSCGCSRQGKASSHWTGYGDISGGFYCTIQQNAKRRKIDFNVGIDYLWKLFQQQNGRCALSGEEISLPPEGMKYRSIDKKKTASLDRIDSSKGYVEGNVQWVHKDVNFMKYCFSQKYFLDMCEKILEHTRGSEKSQKASELGIPVLDIDALKNLL